VRGGEVRHVIAVSFLFLAFSVNGYAEPTETFSCKTDDAKKSDFFPDIQATARKINQAVCDALLPPIRKSLTDESLRDEVAAFGSMVKASVTARFKDGPAPLATQLTKQLKHFEDALAIRGRYPRVMPSFDVQKAPGPRDLIQFYYFFDDDRLEEGHLTKEDEKACEENAAFKAPCSVVLLQLKQAIYPYQLNATAFSAHDTYLKLGALSRQWDSYFEGARSQSFVDIALTSLFERKHFKSDTLVGPPERQWFLLHPNLVVENIQAAPDGENSKLALTIEWIGVNWWRDSLIGIPFGVSLTSLYSDRPGVRDVGHGVSLYFDNKYVVGYANHGGKNGVFVSMDVLKLFEDKTKQAERYRDWIKAFPSATPAP
jgi:hypothetical protein